MNASHVTVLEPLALEEKLLCQILATGGLMTNLKISSCVRLKKLACNLIRVLANSRGGDIKTNVSATGFCKLGYTGLACSDCIEGWARFGGKKIR